jgi:hypothetical protein
MSATRELRLGTVDSVAAAYLRMFDVVNLKISCLYLIPFQPKIHKICECHLGSVILCFIGWMKSGE